MNNNNTVGRALIELIMIAADEIIRVRLVGVLASVATAGTVLHDKYVIDA